MVESKNILITAGRSPVTLELARLLHAAGHQIFIADTCRYHICRYSKATKKSYVIPSPRFEPDRFIDSLVDIVEKEKIDCLIPTCEETICLSKGLRQFPESCTVFCSPFELIQPLHNKWSFNCKVEELGFVAPKSYLVTKNDDLSTLTFDKPYILKPCYSRGSQKIRKVLPSEMVTDVHVEPHNPWIAQEWISGNKYCTYGICHNGVIKAHSIYPVEYAVDKNSCVIFKSIEHPKIVEWVKKFVSEVNFTGQIAFDFIEDETGQLYPIECNPRATSGVHLFKPEDNLSDAIFNLNKEIIYPKSGTSRQIAIGMMLYGWQNLPDGKTIENFLSDLLRVKDVVFQLNDLKPFILTPILFLQYIALSQKLKIRIPATFTFDLEWNGESLIEQNPMEKKKQIA